MLTYQDLLELKDNESERMNFCLRLIREHMSAPDTRLAKKAEEYFEGYNTTIMRYEKLIYDALGNAHVDDLAPNHKIACHYYRNIVIQKALYLLGNGVSFSEAKTKDKLGADFDQRMVEAAISACNAGRAFVFWNYDHVDVFKLTEFAPLYDEETGALMAGVRYWQLAPNKPLRMTLYEPDGYNEYIKRPESAIEVLHEKQKYKTVYRTSDASGTEIIDGENYDGFPIVPFYTFSRKSELYGNEGLVDANDLILSGLVNNTDQAEIIYWLVQNAGGMDDIDDAKLIDRIKRTHVVHAENDESITPHSVSVPFEASATAIAALREQLYTNFMALDVKNIASGAATATEIKAAYEPLNQATDLFEMQVTDGILGILKLAGIDDKPSYTRSIVVNKAEESQIVLQAAQFLSEDYVSRKLLEILGDADKANDVLKQKDAEAMERFALADQQMETEQPEEAEEVTANG